MHQEKPNNQDNLSLAFGIRGEQNEMLVSFADGDRILTAEIVEHLGIDKIQEQATALAQISYADFMNAFYETMEKKRLNAYGQNYINGHFSKKF